VNKKIIFGGIAILVAGLFFSNLLTRPRFKNVVFITIDTLNAHHLGAYGAENSPSPNIDKLASDGVLFEKAYSSAPWTKPAFASMFTSLFPSVHGVTAFDRVLSEDKFTLGEFFKSKGFSTAGIISHILIQPQFGYAQGFDSYELIPFKGSVHAVISSLKVTDMAAKWLDTNATNSDKPFFLFLHYFDPHNNYFHHKKFDRTSWYKGPIKSGMGLKEMRALIPKMTPDDVRALRGLYDEEISMTDYSIGLLLEQLKTMGIDDETLIVITADHGEELTDRGFIGHTRSLYDELVRVPFVFFAPGLTPKRIKEPVSTIDLLPTMMGLLGEEPMEWMVGKDLSSAILGEELPPTRPIFNEVDYRAGQITAHKLGVVEGDYKLVFDKDTESYELYNMAKDPKEERDIASEDKAAFARLSAAIQGYKARYQTEAIENQKSVAPKAESQDKIEQLKSLGYL
jgi:arylsulfatase A-like enzyme